MRSNRGKIRLLSVGAMFLTLAACSEANTGADRNADGFVTPGEAADELSKLSSTILAPGLWEIESNAPAMRGAGKVKTCLSPDRAARLDQEIMVFDDWADQSRFPSQRCEFTALTVSNDKADIVLKCGTMIEEYHGSLAASSFEITRKSDLVSLDVSSRGRRIGPCEESNDEL